MIGYITGNILSIYGNEVRFQHDVRQLVIIDDIVIVLIEDPSTGDVRKQPLNNVYAVDKNGKIIWNIKDIVGKDALYSLINVDESKQLIAADFMGIRYFIDVDKMQVVDKKGYRF